MKRSSERESPNKAIKSTESDMPARSAPESANAQGEVEMGDFEDPYGDDFESEDEIFEAGENGEPDQDDNNEAETAQVEAQAERRQRVYIPHRSTPLGPNEQMEPDYSTYVMLHSFHVKWPSLSFDLLPDGLGADRRKFPHSMYIATGTQAARPKDNEVTLMKVSSLSRTLVSENSDDEEEEDDEGVDGDPVLESREMPTTSTTNRLRISPFASTGNEYLGASLAESGDVHIWDFTGAYNSLVRAGSQWAKRPVHTIKNHNSVESYALDWSPLIQSGSLLTGDVEGRIFHTTRQTHGWTTDAAPFVNPVPNESIEDLQWSPVEKTVFASCGSDGHVRIWDTRQAARKPALSVRAANVDVNVMSWNRRAPHLLATGHDDGAFAVWDLRTFTKGSPVADFHFHKQAVTSIEWNPNDESVLALGSEDSTVSLWDLSVEADDEEISEQHRQAAGDLDDIPSQLLFLHWQPNVKEVHWHKQIPGAVVSTGSDGFTIWKSISV